jgi:tetratricopeptide (TPR) repeat protein
MIVFFLIIITYILWFAEIMGLFILYFFFIWEDFYFGPLFEDTRLFIAFFCSILVVSLAFFSAAPGTGLLALLFLLAIPYILLSWDAEEKQFKLRRISKDKEEIKRLEKNIEKEDANEGTFIRLGYLYKDLGDIENALKNFKKACELTGEEVLIVTEREIKALEHQIEEEESKKTFICKYCGAKNYPTRIFCEKCNVFLGTALITHFKKLFNNTLRAAPIAIVLILIFIASLVLIFACLGFFENVLFYTLILANIFMLIKKAIRAKHAYS